MVGRKPGARTGRTARAPIRVGAAVVALALLVGVGYGIQRLRAAEPLTDGDAAVAQEPHVPLDEEGLQRLAQLVDDGLQGREEQRANLLTESGGDQGPAYVGLRAGGLHVASSWGHGETLEESILEAVSAVRREAGAEVEEVDAAELCLSHSYVGVEPGSDETRLLTNVHRGVIGMELAFDGAEERHSPTVMLAQNRSFERVLELFMRSVGARDQDILSGALQVRAFECDQVLVHLDDSPSATRMQRGNEPVELEEVTRERVERLADDLVGWLVRAVQDDGRMVYKYWPSRGQESQANNLIRQWMATNVLLEVARGPQGWDEEILDLVQSNIRYNLGAFYELEDDLGLIDEDGKVKLGAVALAAMALNEFPTDEFQEERESLDRTIEHLWQEDGSFRTFHRPADRNDNQNFYPGEALLYWATKYRQDPDPELLDRFMRSFEYYQAWHLDDDNRNPAFVPWHTQAYYAMWQETGDEQLRDFMFEMNDWLLDLQEWDDARYPDVRGRFYDADRAHFGPPHASSTGVYLEGLADAYRLALDVGDEDRAQAYRLAIRRGLRSILQLQFVDEIDMYYISQRDRVRGGMRTTVYDNEIRVDNVQHPLIAIHKVLDAFSAADFRDE